MMAEAWQDYVAKVMSPDAPPIQRQESRRAFYAGARALLDGLLAGIDIGTEPTVPDLTMMDQAVAELEAFSADVVAGRA